jgi:hypothetical protein
VLTIDGGGYASPSSSGYTTGTVLTIDGGGYASPSSSGYTTGTVRRSTAAATYSVVMPAQAGIHALP